MITSNQSGSYGKARQSPWEELQKLREDMESCKKDFREARYALLGQAPPLARLFRTFESAWLGFMADPFWDGLGRRPTMADRTQPLGFLLRSGGFCKEPEHPRRMVWQIGGP